MQSYHHIRMIKLRNKFLLFGSYLPNYFSRLFWIVLLNKNGTIKNMFTFKLREEERIFPHPILLSNEYQ